MLFKLKGILLRHWRLSDPPWTEDKDLGRDGNEEFVLLDWIANNDLLVEIMQDLAEFDNISLFRLQGHPELIHGCLKVPLHPGLDSLPHRGMFRR